MRKLSTGQRTEIFLMVAAGKVCAAYHDEHVLGRVAERKPPRTALATLGLGLPSGTAQTDLGAWRRTVGQTGGHSHASRITI